MDPLTRSLMMAGNSITSAPPEPEYYIDDYFSTTLYTGSGASPRTLVTGIDLQNNDGLIWIKSRTGTNAHALYDTVRGATKELSTSSTAAETTQAQGVTGFTSTGFTCGNLARVNGNGVNLVAWTFRKKEKFFDIVTYTGDSNPTQTLNHSLNCEVGFIMVKTRSAVGRWDEYSRYATGDFYLTNAATQTASKTIIPSATTTQFTVGSTANTGGVQYVAYLFAHDPSGWIHCGGGVVNGTYTEETIGWENQWALIHDISGAGEDPVIVDPMRGTGFENSFSQREYSVSANYADPEFLDSAINTNSFGMNLDRSYGTFAWILVRKGNDKPVTSPSQVFNSLFRTGTGAAATITTNIKTDLVIARPISTAAQTRWWSRTRGFQLNLVQTSTAAQANLNSSITRWDVQNGFKVGTGAPNTATAYMLWCFRQARGFFDEVLLPRLDRIGLPNGNYYPEAMSHNLKARPLLVIEKSLFGAQNWGASFVDGDDVYEMNANTATAAVLRSGRGTYFTDTHFWPARSILNNTDPLTNSGYYSCLFGTLPGISKVGKYIGTGSDQTIDCGLVNAPRFLLIKNLLAAGNWSIFDAARGLSGTGTDAPLYMNVTTLAGTPANILTSTTSGFNLIGSAGGYNTSGDTYIFLAIA